MTTFKAAVLTFILELRLFDDGSYSNAMFFQTVFYLQVLYDHKFNSLQTTLRVINYFPLYSTLVYEKRGFRGTDFPRNICISRF